MYTKPADKPVKLSIIIPVYNEANNIVQIVQRVSQTEFDKEIIIVDDYSQDGTRDLLKRRMENYDHIKVLYHQQNRGKCAAIRTALTQVTGDIVIIQDGDLEYNPSDYGQLISPICSGEYKVVYGSRFLKLNEWLVVIHWTLNKLLGRHYELIYITHFLGVHFLNLLALCLYGIKVTDIATGYKVFKSDVIKNIHLKTDRFEFCFEVTAKIAKKNIKIKEVPIQYHPRSILEGKKITWKDGYWAIWTLIKYRFKS